MTDHSAGAQVLQETQALIHTAPEALQGLLPYALAFAGIVTVATCIAFLARTKPDQPEPPP